MKLPRFNIPLATSLLLIVVGLCYWPLLNGKEFIFDDIEFVYLSPELARVTSLGGCLDFSPQPTKPVTNLVLALTYFWGKGHIEAHRLCSLVLHAANVLLLWFLLIAFARHSSVNVSGKSLWIGALWFAIHPIHTETLAISQFRADALSTFFALLALGAVFEISTTLESESPRLKSLIKLGGLILLAQMSKETMTFSLPAIACLLLWGLRVKRNVWRPVVATLLATIAFGVVFLYYQIPKDAVGSYTYLGRVGVGSLTKSNHLQLAYEALSEGLWKLASGTGLSLIRLSERYPSGLAKQFVGALFLVLTAVFISIKFFRRERAWSFWVLAPLAAYLPFLIIPNVNMGSEHYWYFTSVFLGGALGFIVEKILAGSRFSPWPVIGVLTFYLFSLGYHSFQRSGRFERQASVYFDEVKNHPEAKSAWFDLIDGLIRNDETVPLAKTLTSEYEKLFSEDARLRNLRFELAQIDGNWPRAKELLEIVDKDASRPRVLARVHRSFALFSAQLAKCDEARMSLKRATELDPAVVMSPERAEIIHRFCG